MDFLDLISLASFIEPSYRSSEPSEPTTGTGGVIVGILFCAGIVVACFLLLG